MQEKISLIYESKQLLKVSEVARILNISLSMVYKIIQEGKLPSIRLGKAIRIRLVDLESIICGNK